MLTKAAFINSYIVKYCLIFLYSFLGSGYLKSPFCVSQEKNHTGLDDMGLESDDRMNIFELKCIQLKLLKQNLNLLGSHGAQMWVLLCMWEEPLQNRFLVLRQPLNLGCCLLDGLLQRSSSRAESGLSVVLLEAFQLNKDSEDLTFTSGCVS